jgi:hypothetical protein
MCQSELWDVFRLLPAFFYKAIVATYATTAALKNDVEAAPPTDSPSCLLRWPITGCASDPTGIAHTLSRPRSSGDSFGRNPQFASLA